MDQRRAFAFIFCTVTLDMLAAGLMIPVRPGLRDRSGARRPARRHRHTAALLGLGRRRACERRLRLVRAAGIPAVERRMAFDWKRANPVGALRLLATHRELSGLAVSNFFGQLAHQVLPAVTVLYASYRYGWGELNVGLMLAFVSVCSAIVQGLLVGPVVARIGERRAVMVGLLFGAAGMALYGLAPTGLLFPGGRAGDVALGTGKPRDAGADEPADQPVRAGPAAGRQLVDRQRRRVDRTGRLHRRVLRVPEPPAGRCV
jgi:Na+/melibiose symporter-like transporter